MLKKAELFYFCHLKKFVRPETFGPYHVFLGYSPRGTAVSVRVDGQLGSNWRNIPHIFGHSNRCTNIGIFLSLLYAVILDIV